jgi:DUF4097 and DUF4098 domain-containing protein YvlB
MIGIIAAITVLAAGAAPQSLDTTMTVTRGARLRVEARAGSIDIGIWDRNAVRVVADRPASDIDVHYGGDEVSVESESDDDAGRVTYHITVPQWMDLHVESQSSDVSIDGAGGEVVVESTEGAIRLRGGQHFVSLTSVSGALHVADARARVRAETVNQGITLEHVTGEVNAETVNGDVVLSDVDSGNVKGSTINGTVTFRGDIRPQGFYHLESHNGRVGVFITRPPDATIAVTAFNGTFDTDFPLRLTSTTDGRHMTFVVGSGSARVELDSFNGPIVLGRSGGPRDHP